MRGSKCQSSDFNFCLIFELINSRTMILMGLITVFDAILTGRHRLEITVFMEI